MTRDEASDIKNRHREALLKLPGVQGLCVKAGTADDATLLISVESHECVSSLPKTIDGLPVTVEVTGRFVPLDGDDGLPKS